MHTLHMVANFPTIIDPNQTQDCSLYASHTGILSTKYRNEKSNIRADEFFQQLFILYLACVIIYLLVR